MKKFLSFTLLFLICCFITGCPKCIENPEDDGSKPKATITIGYKAGGHDFMFDINDSLASIIPLTGYPVVVPENTEYALMFSANDGGCIKKFQVYKREWSSNNGTLGEWVLVEKDFSSCAYKNRIWAQNYQAGSSNWRSHLLRVVDFADEYTDVLITVMPAAEGDFTPPAENCTSTGDLTVPLKWNGLVQDSVWRSDAIKAADLVQYCEQRKIKRITFTITKEECQTIHSTGWHIKFDEIVIDIPNDDVPPNKQDDGDDFTDSYSCSFELDQPVYEGLKIELWPDVIWKANWGDAPVEECDTGSFGDIQLVLHISD